MKAYSKKIFILAGSLQEFKMYINAMVDTGNYTFKAGDGPTPVAWLDDVLYQYVTSENSLIGEKDYELIKIGRWETRNPRELAAIDIRYNVMRHSRSPKIDLKYDPDTMDITLNGELIDSWNDEATIDYPEDLTWSRTIGGLCSKMIKAGYELGKKETLDDHSKVTALTYELNELKNPVSKLNKDYEANREITLLRAELKAKQTEITEITKDRYFAVRQWDHTAKSLGKLLDATHVKLKNQEDLAKTLSTALQNANERIVTLEKAQQEPLRKRPDNDLLSDLKTKKDY